MNSIVKRCILDTFSDIWANTFLGIHTSEQQISTHFECEWYSLNGLVLVELDINIQLLNTFIRNKYSFWINNFIDYCLSLSSIIFVIYTNKLNT